MSTDRRKTDKQETDPVLEVTPPEVGHLKSPSTKTSEKGIEEGLLLKVKKAAGPSGGIVITWERGLNPSPEALSYELEGSKKLVSSDGSAPPALHWARIGTPISPLPLPMACNLNNFKPGVMYFFRVKAVGSGGALSYSNIASISL